MIGLVLVSSIAIITRLFNVIGLLSWLGLSAYCT